MRPESNKQRKVGIRVAEQKAKVTYKDKVDMIA